VVRLGGVTVVNDAYNANPESMAAALDEFAAHYPTTGSRHFACGDMLELGESSADEHRALGRRIAQSRIDRLWLFGAEVRETRTAAVDAGFDRRAVFLTDDYAKLEKAFLADVREADVVLVKGSRRMRLERLVEALRAQAH
jgi:UDP-N-acetylmuramoyl-tripeptide--D-alanyl-D-alanine ligase